MGFYINPQDQSKEQWLATNATAITEAQAAAHTDFTNYLPVCLVDNGPFTAAGIAYNAEEARAFMHPDQRPKQWFMVTKTALQSLQDPSHGPLFRG